MRLLGTMLLVLISVFIASVPLVFAVGDSYVNVVVRDQSQTILSEASVEIYEIDSATNESYLVNTLYGNTEKQVLLTAGVTYKAVAILEDYIQDTGFMVFKPEEFSSSDLVIVMKESTSDSDYSIQKNVGNYITFNGTSVNFQEITITIDSLSYMDSCYIAWSINGSQQQTYTANPHITSYEKSRDFTRGDDQHEIYVYIEGELEKVFIIQEQEQIGMAEITDDISTSKIGFIIFFLFTIGAAGSIQSKAKKYGIETLTGLSIIFSFINYYMLILALPLIIGLIAKKVTGGEQ